MTSPVTESLAKTVRKHTQRRRNRFLDLCRDLVEIETPSDRPEAFSIIFQRLEEEFAGLDMTTRRIPGKETGGCLYARPRHRERGRAGQLVLGHADTVWSVGTLENQPFEVGNQENRAFGPGLFDMKAGLAQLIVALEVLGDIDRAPPLTPVVLINSDEEIGSPESTRHIRRLASAVERALVLEPAMGPEGKIKTARKGVGQYEITLEGKAAHAGLSPEKGSSAILELTHLIQQLNDLNDPESGVTVNVGVIGGGTRSNVVARQSYAEVDFRVTDRRQAKDIDRKVRSIRPGDEDVELSVAGGFDRPPMERTERNRALWKKVRRAGSELGMDLEETRSGGGSDGNTTSQHTATVDGLGPVGDGAHEVGEYIMIDETLERTALLSLILLLR